MVELILVALLALAAGLLIGWLVANRRAAALGRDLAVATTRAADAELIRRMHGEVERERNAAQQDLAAAREGVAARDAALTRTHEQIGELTRRADFAEAERARLDTELAGLRSQAVERDKAHRDSLDALRTHFEAAAGQALEVAQTKFLDRAQQRFAESEKLQGEKIAQLLQPVESTLKRYEDNLGRVEKEREGSYRELSQAVSQLATNSSAVVKETQRLTNVMVSSPKARGRWGEEHLRTVLESAGLSENVDFELQTTVDSGDRKQRPDCIVNLPGNRCIVIDVKNVWTHFEAAYDETDERRRSELLLQHTEAMRKTAIELGGKNYWSKFDRSPDFVIMFIPGEHVLAAAAERAPDLIASAYRHGVIIASTINTLALAKVMAGIWRQDKLAGEARAIAELGKELFSRLSAMGAHVSRLGKNLATANEAYNAFVGSLESKVLTQAKRFETLNIDTGGKQIESPPLVEQSPRPLAKLIAADETAV